MKVLMLCGNYLPATIGGTEIFTHSLNLELVAMGIEVHVAFHGDCDAGTYEINGIPVHVLGALPTTTRESIYTLEIEELPGYLALLDQLHPDLVHGHSWSRCPSLSHLQATRAAGYPLLITHHVPGMTCLQRSLLYKGLQPCDGEIRVGRCTQCRASAFGGLPQPFDALLGHLPIEGLSRYVPKPWRRLIGARADTQHYSHAVHACIEAVDCIHVLADWAKNVFLRNGTNPEKLTLIRTGLPLLLSKSPAVPLTNFKIWEDRCRNPNALRVIYWGRISWEKGISILIDAVRSLPNLPLDVVILGSGTDVYRAELSQRVGNDKRIRFVEGVPPNLIAGVLIEADVGIIPSLWFETGPLTVLEAQASRLPLIGSRLGGIAELCEEGKGARLFPPGNVAALASILHELASDPNALARIRSTVPQPRLMKDVAKELVHVYWRLIGISKHA